MSALTVPISVLSIGIGDDFIMAEIRRTQPSFPMAKHDFVEAKSSTRIANDTPVRPTPVVIAATNHQL
jgi:hypothetical protein